MSSAVVILSVSMGSHTVNGRLACIVNQRGSALLCVLIGVALLGLMAGIAGSSWQTIVQRSREADLLWKGNKIRSAIKHYCEYKGQTSSTLSKYPKTLDSLLTDSRVLAKTHYLRKVYADPMTGKDWDIIKAPGGGVMGVRSTSNLKPFKQDGFLKENANFAGKESYQEWTFVYDVKVKKTK